ncbi:MAG TPA: GspH/FimT family pseudopilin [Cellvibrionaceae bacterium]
MKHRVYTAGFTLIEMMVTITIAGILLAVAVPSFKSFITRNAVENLQTRFAAAITAARSEAASRNTFITICGSNNGTACVADQWKAGWIVFVDSNANAAIDAANGTVPADEILLRFQSANTYPIKFQNEANTAINSLSFTSQGFVRNDVRAYATFCSPGKETTFTRGITIERSGRVMKATEIAFDTGTGKTVIAINCD